MAKISDNWNSYGKDKDNERNKHFHYQNFQRNVSIKTQQLKKSGESKISWGLSIPKSWQSTKVKMMKSVHESFYGNMKI